MKKHLAKRTQIALYIIGIIAALFIAMLVFSPYQRYNNFSYRLVKTSIDINAPVSVVFYYLGNSKNASQWSTYVNHIHTLNEDSVRDGMPGSRRRCFVDADEKGAQWDETITEVVPLKKRQLTIYNLKGFPIEAEHLATEQIYETLGNNKCRLTFTVFFKDAEPTFAEYVKMKFAAYIIKSVFLKNLINIKHFTEQVNL
jgi:uncharacterized protein YndB with AHSA1/START domain